MTNAEIAALLSETATLMELAGADLFRIRAYQRAAQTIGSWSAPVAGLPPKELLEIPGVGKSLAQHLSDLARTGTFPEREELRRTFPAGLLELLRVPGLGPKRARLLFESAGVKDLDGLKRALEAGRLADLPGFGAKLVSSLREGLGYAAATRLLRRDALMQVLPLLERLRALRGVERAEAAGSLRRGRETVGDVDVLAAARKGEEIVAAFTRFPGIENVIGRGPTKASVRLKGGLQCDLRVVPPESFGAALQYFTGSKDHNVALRRRALSMGLTVNEYGVFKLSDKKQARPLAGRTEEDVYRALGLPYIEPELRENRGELDAAEKGKLPRLIRLSDVRGDFHNHSDHTDGRDSLETMALAARKRGWEWVALGDHSRSLRVARGLSVPELRRTFAELDRVRKRVKGIELMRSMEVDILEDGGLDYPASVLDEIDVVIAAVHSRFKQTSAEMTKRLARAVSDPRVDVLAHPSGRLLNKRPPYEFDCEAVLSAAAAAGTAVEIDGQPERLDLDDARAIRARELGVRLTVDSDAHAASQLELIEEAVIVARRAWLEPKHVLNCLSYGELRAWLESRGKTAAGAA